MKKRKIKISKISFLILQIGMPIILFYFVYLIIAITSLEGTSPSVILHIYAPQFEHIIMSLTILILGALLIDITYKEINQQKK